MAKQTHSESDVYVRFSHYGLSFALALLFALGALAIVLVAFPDSAAAGFAGQAMKILPIGIVMCIGLLLRPIASKSLRSSGPGMLAVLNDELRQFSLHRAYRNGFIAMLILQPLLALLISNIPATYPLVLMAAASATTGAIVVLASVLWYDR